MTVGLFCQFLTENGVNAAQFSVLAAVRVENATTAQIRKREPWLGEITANTVQALLKQGRLVLHHKSARSHAIYQITTRGSMLLEKFDLLGEDPKSNKPKTSKE